MANLSVSEIISIHNGKFEVVKPNECKFTWIPESSLRKTKELLEDSDIETALEYLSGLFEIYRGSVCRAIIVPHQQRDGIYEWLEPAEFGWIDIEKVIETAEIDPRQLEGMLHTEFRYKIDNPSSIKWLGQNRWQNASLAKYASKVRAILQKLQSDKMNSFEAIEEIQDLPTDLQASLVSWNYL